MTTHWRRHRPKEANSVSLFLQIWQLMMPTLSQRLGSFPTESRAEIFPHCRQDCSLPRPITRGGFDGLRKEKIRSKVSQKSASSWFLPPSLCLSLSLRPPNSQTRPPPPLSPAWPPPSPPHLSLSTIHFSFFLHSGSSPLASPLTFSSSLLALLQLSFLPPAPPSTTSSTTRSHQPTIESHCEPFSLIYKPVSSFSHSDSSGQNSPPTPQSASRLPRPDHLQPHSRPVTAASSPPQGCLPLHSTVCNCKVACRTWTYYSCSANNSLTWAGPVLAQLKWLGRVQPDPRKVKINSKTLSKKICDFLVYFSTHFAWYRVVYLHCKIQIRY